MSCVAELIRCGLVHATQEEMSALDHCKYASGKAGGGSQAQEDAPALLLLSTISREADGLSGRALRKMPFRGMAGKASLVLRGGAKGQKPGGVPLQEYLKALLQA